MSAYRLFGAETSPYSLKVRAFLRYKGIAFEWVTRSRETETDFRALARHATVPLLVSPDRPVSQESTRMLFALESSHPEPSATPDDPAPGSAVAHSRRLWRRMAEQMHVPAALVEQTRP